MAMSSGHTATAESKYGVYLGFGQTHNRLVWAPGAQTQCVHCPNWPIGAGMQHLGAIGCPTGGPGLGPSVPNPAPPEAKSGGFGTCSLWWPCHTDGYGPGSCTWLVHNTQKAQCATWCLGATTMFSIGPALKASVSMPSCASGQFGIRPDRA